MTGRGGTPRLLFGLAWLLTSGLAVGHLVGGGVLWVLVPGVIVLVTVVAVIVRTVREDSARNEALFAASPFERPASPSTSASQGRIDA